MELDLLSYQKYLKIREAEAKKYIWGQIRRKWLILQPEELVRQLTIAYLIHHQNISSASIAVEKSFSINNIQKRIDILVFQKNMKPLLLVECKSFTQNIDFSTVEQIASYNAAIEAPYLLLTNGSSHLLYHIDFREHKKKSLLNFPILLES